MTALIDYDAGNMRSVEKALRALGDRPVITRDRDTILRADRVILPGVGAFRDCRNNLEKYDLEPAIREVIAKGTPFLGICVGMQLLFSSSEEGNELNSGEPVPGLRIFPGQVRKIPDTPGLKIPHMGWNSLTIAPGTRLFRGIPDGSFVYFVHSYCAAAEGQDFQAAETEYGMRILAAAERDNVFSTQFHPEKSSETGLRILKNFLEI
ncbi:MAG: imidazole glycerol phosphate synthase subunit HisH [Stomatobaculum sp.]|nr:imidazole glycerol phosphate synthase subunit HisH [Stomatobaculum sp.]